MEPNVAQTPQAPPQQDLTCFICHVVSPATFFFCPNCGHLLRPKPLSTTVLHQIGLYLLAALLPPLGLFPGIKYLRGKTDAEKTVGIVLIILTVVSTVVTIWLSLDVFNNFQKIMVGQQISPGLLQ